MDCKKALVEAEGIDAAIDILRKKGQKVAAKRSTATRPKDWYWPRPTLTTTGAVIVLNCETTSRTQQTSVP